MKKLGIIAMLALTMSLFCCTEKPKGGTSKETIIPSPPVSSIKFDFEDGIQDWAAMGKVQLLQNTAKHKTGKASLEIKGIGQSGFWGFARSRQFNVFPGKHYKVSGWMLIDSISNDTSFFKCEFWNDGKWAKNIGSSQYDLNKKKEWQELTAVCDAPEGKNVALSISVDKRPMEKDVSAVLYIDDIRIEKTD
jgi:hypothetical protein